MPNFAEELAAQRPDEVALVDGDRSFSEWTFDCTFEGGVRMTNDQVTARTWKDGQVVFERYYYTPNLSES